MKTYLFAGLLAFGLVLSATTRLSAADAPAVPATHEGLLQELLKSIGELTTVLESIKDEAGLPAAKEKLTAIMRRQHELSEAMQKLGEPKPEDEAKLKEKYEAKMNTDTEKLGAQYQRLAAIEAFGKLMGEIKAEVEKK